MRNRRKSIKQDFEKMTTFRGKMLKRMGIFAKKKRENVQMTENCGCLKGYEFPAYSQGSIISLDQYTVSALE